jgi:endonuclease/exonuclease/phosphatase family metal-dependent hydrolase
VRLLRALARSFVSLRYPIEAALIGLFFVQALRFLIGTLYSHVASASIFPAIDPTLVDPNIPGLLEPAIVSAELTLLVYMLALPLLTLFLGRVRIVLLIAAIGAAVARALLNQNAAAFSAAAAAAFTLGFALVYLSLLIRWNGRFVPYFFIGGFGADQFIRAFGNTLDPSWSAQYATIQLVLSALVILLSLVNTFRREPEVVERHLLPFWGGLGLGGLLFLELSLLALPNAIAGRADVDYTLFVPFVLLATLLPLVPQVRQWGRQFLGLFDAGLRGWAWMLLVVLLVVFGTRFTGVFGGVMLVIAQFCVSMMWWWLIRPQAEKERNISGLWLPVSMLLLSLLIVCDLFTYEYAYVRDFSAQFRFLNSFLPALLRGFRGLGLAVILLAVFFAALPMVQMRLRIPWRGGTFLQSLFAFFVVVAASAGAAYAARPIVVSPVQNVDRLRVATYNIHAGYNEFFNYNLEAIAQNIRDSGADVVLLQEIEAGRLTSFSVDQPLWLGRRLQMDVRFFPTNEGLQGLAVLSRVPIVYDDGRLLTSIGSQTGLQRVQIAPDEGVITVYNTWLGLLAERVGSTTEDQERDQQQQLAEIIQYIALDHTASRGVLGRTIVGGTFNNIPDSQVAQQMLELGFFDPFAGMPSLLSDTFWQTTRRARLDYLWLYNLGEGIGAIATESHASDHRLAVVEVAITR